MIGRLQCVVLDCPNARELAEFYRALLGGTFNQADPRWAVSDDFVTLHPDAGPATGGSAAAGPRTGGPATGGVATGRPAGSGLVLTFQRVADYRAPQWPDAEHPQQFHLDVEVPDLDRADEQVVAHGATLRHADPRGWRVYADPAGHPFCLLRGGPAE
jgi:catechol 2,3-dioxygenase-like lactoylglutathione lyase family enzyme